MEINKYWIVKYKISKKKKHKLADNNINNSTQNYTNSNWDSLW